MKKALRASAFEYIEKFVNIKREMRIKEDFIREFRERNTKRQKSASPFQTVMILKRAPCAHTRAWCQATSINIKCLGTC